MFRKKVTFSLVSVIFPKDLFSDFNTLSPGNEMNVSFQVLITSALKLILDLKIASIGINMSINGAHFFWEYQCIVLSTVSIKKGLQRLPNLHLWPAAKYQEVLCPVKSSYINIRGEKQVFKNFKNLISWWKHQKTFVRKEIYILQYRRSSLYTSTVSDGTLSNLQILSCFWFYLGNKRITQLLVWGKFILNWL